MQPAGRSLRAVFVDTQDDLYDKHSVYSLAAHLQKMGADVSYVSSRSQKRLVRQVIDKKPDLVLYSSFSHLMPGYAAFDAALKQQYDVTSVIGGFGPTFNPSYIDNTTIDSACVSEADIAIYDFIANGFHTCNNFYVKGEPFSNKLYPLADLDSLPIPDRDIVYAYDAVKANQPSKQFLSGRGCPYLCSYCYNHSYNNLVKAHGENIVRKKSVDYIIAEVDLVRKKYPLHLVMFSDDTFVINKKWFFEFCEKFPSKIGIAYSCNIRANLVDEDLIRALKESNCIAVNWSIESGDEQIRNQVLKRNMSDEQILNTAELLNKYKINYRIGNVIGIPGETKEQMLKTVELNMKARPALGMTLANILVPYPGLDITKYAIEKGYYTEMPEDKLPVSFFSYTVMNVPEEFKHWIQKLLYLFPLFVRFQYLYTNRYANKLMFLLPKLILRPVYELFFGFMFQKVYRIKSGFMQTLRFYIRYFKNLVDY